MSKPNDQHWYNLPVYHRRTFWNTKTNKAEAECTQERNGRWYIKPGFAGSNLSTNKEGYKSKTKAEAQVLVHQNHAVLVKE